MRNLITKLALACLLFSPLPAFAQERCIPLEAGLEILEKAEARHRVLSDDERQRAVDIFNATPPVGEFTFGLAIWAELPSGVAAVFFGNGEQLCARQIFRPHDVESVRHIIEGPRA
jgi:hypothetical protein